MMMDQIFDSDELNEIDDDDDPKDIVEDGDPDDLLSEDENEDEDGDSKEPKPSTANVLLPSDKNYKLIKNKIIRNQQYQKDKRELKKLKKKEKKIRQKEGGEKMVPRTIDNQRIPDETMIGDLNAEDNEIIRDELECDEFSSYFKNTYEPKVLITYSDNPLKKTRVFGRELTRIIPNSLSRYRNRSGVKKIVRSAVREGFSDVLVVNENRHEPNGLLLIHLPHGPTAHFKLSNVRITNELRKSHKAISAHRPEVILNNFSTRLGLTVSRMLAALFHCSPEFEGKRAVAFHNQRDYVFFRHYVYSFSETGQKTRLRELGPRFTLKLRSLQKGTFDSVQGHYMWTIEGKRHRVQDSRRKFFL